MARKSERKHALTNAERVAAYRERKRKKGLCIASGCWNKTKGTTECDDCQQDNTERKRKARKQAKAGR